MRCEEQRNEFPVAGLGVAGQGPAWPGVTRQGKEKLGDRMEIKTARAHLKSIAPYSQCRHYETPEKDKERPDDYETRTWADRLHVNNLGNVFLPAMGFKNGISSAAKFLGQQIPGKGKSTYTKHFEAGVMVLSDMVLKVRKEDVPGEWLFVPANGVRGFGKRVKKCFPVIHEWEGVVEFTVVDSVITKSVFEEHLIAFGQFIGVGRFRPQNNGIYGRFKVVGIEWSEETV